MNKIILACLCLLPLKAFNQSFPPGASEQGTTAIIASSPLFVAWATNCIVERGLMQINNPNLGYASYGSVENVIGPVLGTSTANVLSLGDRGIAIMTFDTPITNGPGADFAVFENSFNDNFLELAFVEVSSNGVDYSRFPAYSETDQTIQISNSGNVDPKRIHNLAGKYKIGYGTPFDLSELPENPLVNINKITHVRLIDVVGTILPEFGSRDALDRLIIDPFPTPFATSGFDLSGLGVIHEHNGLATEKNDWNLRVYPNPTSEKLTIHSQYLGQFTIVDINGKEIAEGVLNESLHTISTIEWQSGIYFLSIKNGDQVKHQKITKM